MIRTLFAPVFFIPMLTHANDLPAFFPPVGAAVDSLAAATNDLSDERRAVLDPAAKFIASKLAAGKQAQLTFICTHNSRRSHLAQVWAQVAADYYGLKGISTYSGGTEATACNIRTVRALRRAGLQIVATTNDSNPRYLVQYAENRLPLTVFSKIYNSSPNPTEVYAAMMCCSDVDESCPVVHGAELRVPLHYIDPKASDNTPEEAVTYDERSQQIAGEMFYVMACAAHVLGAK